MKLVSRRKKRFLFKPTINSGCTEVPVIKPPSYCSNIQTSREGQIYHTRLRLECSSLNQQLFLKIYSRTSMARTPWNHENMFETRVVRANECYSLHHIMRHNRDIFSIFFDMKVYCVFSLESPHRGDSNEYIQYTIFNVEKKITLNYPKSAATGFFQGTQERVRNSRDKRAISVRATEVLL